jgi:poly(A) polymerase
MLRADLLARLPAPLRAPAPPGLHLVGGAVRDLLRGGAPKDWDAVVIGDPGVALAHFSALSGRPPVLLGKEREATTWRFPLGEIEVDLTAAAALDADLRRRDFTINAMALSLPGCELSDPLGGGADLRAGLICANPGALAADPLRLLRAHRFAATLDFRIDDATAAEIDSICNRGGSRRSRPLDSGFAAAPRSIEGCAVERITEELDRLLAAPRAARELAAMRADGLLFAVLPELVPIDGLTQNHFHHTDVLSHVLEAVAAGDDLAGLSGLLGGALPEISPADYLLFKWAVLLHDLGKAQTRTEGSDGKVHFYGHEIVSERLVMGLAERLRFSHERRDRLARLARFHLRFLMLHKNQASPTAYRRLVRDLSTDLPLLILLALADKSATRGTGSSDTVTAIAELGKEALRVYDAEHHHLHHLPKLIDGLSACAILGVRPGPALGKALDALLEKQIEGSVNDREGAEEFLRNYEG